MLARKDIRGSQVLRLILGPPALLVSKEILDSQQTLVRQVLPEKLAQLVLPEKLALLGLLALRELLALLGLLAPLV